MNISRLKHDKILYPHWLKHPSEEWMLKKGYMEDQSFVEAKFLEKSKPTFYTTSVGKLSKENGKNPVVLLTTGGFYPLHTGHRYMMEKAKEKLSAEGYTVIGGYFSPSNDKYVKTKDHMHVDGLERVTHITEELKDSWLDIDPWECLYADLNCSFTEVVLRLENYLQTNVNSEIQVAYVFGGDNAEFAEVLAGRLSVCVNRGRAPMYAECKQKYASESNFFIDANPYEAVASLNYRKVLKKESTTGELKGVYLTREDGLCCIPSKVDKTNVAVKASYDILRKRILSELHNYFLLDVVDAKEQLEKAQAMLGTKPVISIDTLYASKYTCRLEISRLFHGSSQNGGYVGMTPRVGYKGLRQQLRGVDRTKQYTLLDDDSATGTTVNTVINILQEEGINVGDIFLLSDLRKNPAPLYDVVDLRDFIFGAKNSGLTQILPNGCKCRVPYIEPYVNLHTRASIPTKDRLKFTNKLVEINQAFYKALEEEGCVVTVADCDEGFRIFCNNIGFEDNASILGVCEYLRLK